MSAKLHISDELSLPLDLITLRTAIYGTSGSGKTTFMRLLAEKVHEARHRFCAIDLKNDWFGLKSSADGTEAGMPVVIFGGPRRDVQLFDDAGAITADTVASIDQSVVVDLDEFSRYKQLKFLTTFLDRLYDVNRGPLLVIADEADRYAPQKPMSPEAIMSLSAAEDICRRGRKRGIGSCWLTQRTAVLNKNVSDICDLTVVFRTPGSRDLKELEDRVGRIANKQQTAEVMRLAPGVEDGQAIFLSSHPKLRKYLPDPVRPIQLPLPWTFDSSATPGVGHRRREPKVLAKTDLAAIESKMAAQVQRAKDDDPKELRKQIGELKRQVQQAQKEKPAAAPAKEKRIEVPIVKDSQIQRLERAAKSLDGVGGKFVQAMTYATDRLKPLKEAGDAVTAAVAQILGAIKKPVQPQPAIAAQQPRFTRPAAQPIARPQKLVQAAPARRESDANGDGGESEQGITKRQQRMLNAAATLTTLGVEVTKETVCGWLGIHPRGGSVGEELKALSDAGLVITQRGNTDITVTEAGMAAAEQLDPGEAIKRAKSGLTPRQARIFDIIVGVYPESATKEYVASQMTSEKKPEGVHPRGGSLGEDIGRLAGRGLITSNSGVLKARDFLFNIARSA